MPRKLTEERQRAKDEKQIFIDFTIDFRYVNEEWEKRGLHGCVRLRGSFPPELNEDLMRAWLLLLNRTPLDDPSHKKKKTKKKARKKPKKVR